MFSSRQVLTLALLFCLLLFGRFAVALIFKTRVYAAFACWTLGHVGPKISLGASGLMYRGLNAKVADGLTDRQPILPFRCLDLPFRCLDFWVLY